MAKELIFVFCALVLVSGCQTTSSSNPIDEAGSPMEPVIEGPTPTEQSTPMTGLEVVTSRLNERISQLKSETQALQDENQVLKDETQALKNETQALREENERIRTQLVNVSDELARAKLQAQELAASPDKAKSSRGLRIASLVPNPSGNERENEEVSIFNDSDSAQDLTGWTLRDAAGRAWVLDAMGTIGAQQSKSLKRGGQVMSMANGGDTIQLVSSDGTVVQSVTYDLVGENEIVTVVTED